MSIRIKGAWPQAQVDEFLKQRAYPIRIATVGVDGFPRVVSLWYCYEAGKLLSVTHQDSFLVGLLRKNDKVGFEVSPNEPPYHGVRGHGVVTLEPLGQQSILVELLHHYLGGVDSTLASWLLSRSDEELLVTLDPLYLYSWDYRERMAGIA